MRTVVNIQARMGSRRLPGKVLAEAGGKPLLRHQVERIGRCETINEIIVATPSGLDNEPIWDLLYPMGIRVYSGSEDDVLSRVLGAAQIYQADLIVELTADCSLIDPEIVDEVVQAYVDYYSMGVDFASNSRDVVGELSAYPRGMDVRVFSLKTLERVSKLTQDPRDREHVSLYIWEHRGEFSIHGVFAPKWARDDIRLTVDEPADLELVRNIFEYFYPRNDFSLKEILNYLNENPELREINRSVRQKVA